MIKIAQLEKSAVECIMNFRTILLVSIIAQLHVLQNALQTLTVILTNHTAVVEIAHIILVHAHHASRIKFVAQYSLKIKVQPQLHTLNNSESVAVATLLHSGNRNNLFMLALGKQQTCVYEVHGALRLIST